MDPSAAAQYAASGRPIPELVRGWALIDTGAGQSGLHEEMAIGLHLHPIGSAEMHTPAGDPIQVGVFWGQVTFPQIEIPPLRQQFLGMQLGYPVAGLPVVAILGRDFLRGGCFVYDGVAGAYTLSYGEPAVDDRVVATWPTQI